MMGKKRCDINAYVCYSVGLCLEAITHVTVACARMCMSCVYCVRVTLVFNNYLRGALEHHITLRVFSAKLQQHLTALHANMLQPKQHN